MNSKMLFYILKRVLLALLTIWIVITVTFFVMHAIPGGPFVSEKAISKEAQAALQQMADRDYDAEFRAQGVEHVLHYGIAFCGKRVCVELVRDF